MTNVTDLDLSWREFALLTLALAIGLIGAGATWPLLFFVHVQSREFEPIAGEWWPPLATGITQIVKHVVAITAAPPTLLIAMMPLIRRRDRRRASWQLPGVAACAAASLVLLAELTYQPVQSMTLYGELTRAQGSAISNIMQLPRFLPALTVEGWWSGHSVLFDLVPALTVSGWWSGIAMLFPLGPHAGFAVLGVLAARLLARTPRGLGGSLDRLGLGLGATWLVLALAFALLPLA